MRENIETNDKSLANVCSCTRIVLSIDYSILMLMRTYFVSGLDFIPVDLTVDI